MPYRFKEIRLQSGKSVAEVATELGVAETFVRIWDNGYKNLHSICSSVWPICIV